MRYTTYAQDALSSLYHDGGFTLDPLLGYEPRDGWAVGMTGYQQTMPLAKVTAADIDAHAKTLPPHLYQGGWVDQGTVYLDAVQVEPDQQNAEKLGRENGQKAIYNLRTRQTVWLAQQQAA